MRISDWSSDVCSSDLLCIQEDAVFEGSTILAPMLLCTLQCLIFTFREEKLLRGLLEEPERSRILASSWRTSSIVMPLARSLQPRSATLPRSLALSWRTSPPAFQNEANSTTNPPLKRYLRLSTSHKSYGP